MDRQDIILWVLGGGFGLMVLIWHNITYRIEKLDEKLTDVDRRLCRMEGAMTAKDCCILKDDQHMRKVE